MAKLNKSTKMRSIDTWERLFLHSPICTLLFNKKSKNIQLANQAFQELIPSDLMTQHLDDLFIAGELIEFFEFLNTLKAYDIVNTTLTFRLPNLKVKNIDLQLSLFPFVEDDSEYVVGHAYNASKDLVSEQLQISEKKFRDLANAMPQLVWTCLAEGPCDYLSEGWVEYTGIPELTQLGYGWLDQLHPDDKQRTIDEWGQKVKSGDDFVIQFRIRNAQGEYKQFFTKAVPMRNEHGEIVKWLGSNTNIEELELIKTELVKAKEQAESSNKAKSHFLANTSHEIRTPLSIISGYVQSLLLKTEKHNFTKEVISSLNNIETASDNLTSIVNDVLDLSKIEAGKTTPIIGDVEIRVLLNEICHLHNNNIVNKSLTLAKNIPNNVPTLIKTDIHLFRQVLINLISNAIKFTPDHKRIDINLTLLNNQIKIDVIDEGIGIPKDQFLSIFEPFEQVDNSITKNYVGTGLGLAICKKNAELLGGNITVSQTEYGGSCFTFIIPNSTTNKSCIREELPVIEEKNITSNENFKHTVLIIDDNEMIRDLLTDVIEDMGFKAQTANNGLIGLEQTQRHLPSLILLDLRMPIMSGFEFISLIKQKETLCAIPIICISGEALNSEIEEALELGADEYITKPFDLKLFISTINSYLKK